MESTKNYRALLDTKISKANIDSIVRSVHNNPENFVEIYQLMDDPEIRVSWRATWACEKLSETHPFLFEEQIQDIISRLLSCTHDGSKRLLLSILFNLPVPEELPVPLLEYCFAHMLDKKESIGVQSLCIRLAYRLCRAEPDLLHELRMYLENTETEYYSKAVASAVKNTLRRIN